MKSMENVSIYVECHRGHKIHVMINSYL